MEAKDCETSHSQLERKTEITASYAGETPVSPNRGLQTRTDTQVADRFTQIKKGIGHKTDVAVV